MQMGALRKLEAVHHLADALQHLERTGVARAKLFLGAGLEGLSSAVEQAQPYPISEGKLPVAVGCVVVFLGQLLCLEKPFPNLREHLVALPKKAVHHVRSGRPGRVGQDGRGWPAVDHLKRCGAQCRVEGGIVAVLRPGQPVHPRSRPVTCDTPKIHCDDLIVQQGL